MSIAQYLGDLMGRFSAHKAREEAKSAEAERVQEEVREQNARYFSTLRLLDPTETL